MCSYVGIKERNKLSRSTGKYHVNNVQTNPMSKITFQPSSVLNVEGNLAGVRAVRRDKLKCCWESEASRGVTLVLCSTASANCQLDFTAMTQQP